MIHDNHTFEKNADEMWSLMEALYPIHRTLVGPGFKKSLEIIQNSLPIDILEFASGTKVFDWTIPKAFNVRAAYVEAEDGTRPIDFENCNYHVWNYSQPFTGNMSREELVTHLSTHPELKNAIPLRDTYYREMWGLSASQDQVDSLPDGTYKVVVDTELYDDYLRMGEFYLPGESDEEILINSYLCHPQGANDNLSGVVLAVELFKLLQKMDNRRYSYRLVLWPETIGAITYIASYPERIKRTAAVLCLAIIGDPGQFTYKRSFNSNTELDRCVEHALQHSGFRYEVRDYNPIGGDERQFNTANLRLPCGLLTRTPANEYVEYHTSLDDMSLVKRDSLLEGLKLTWDIVSTLEKNRTYTPHYITEPFLSGHGIYPYDQGMGTGERKGVYNKIVQSYFNLIPYVDGESDLVAIADDVGFNISDFDQAVSDFLKSGLISTVSKDRADQSGSR